MVSFFKLVVPPHRDLGSCQSTTSAKGFNIRGCVSLHARLPFMYFDANSRRVNPMNHKCNSAVVSSGFLIVWLDFSHSEVYIIVIVWRSGP